MKRMALAIFIGLIFYCAVSSGQEIYQWVDEKGTVHFTDDLGQVPERYQDQVRKKETPKEPAAAPLPSTQLPKDKGPKEPQEDSRKKDILGRGEEWWQGKAMEWKQKLTKAQKDYNAAQTALKAKEKELEQSIYKPNSFKRKLQAEIKLLDAKVVEHMKQFEEAKNMLEKVLPKQAEEYRADPSWVRVD